MNNKKSAAAKCIKKQDNIDHNIFCSDRVHAVYVIIDTQQNEDNIFFREIDGIDIDLLVMSLHALALINEVDGLLLNSLHVVKCLIKKEYNRQFYKQKKRIECWYYDFL